MQAEIIEVIKKYCRIVESDVDIKLEQRQRENYLVADIPLANEKGKKDGRVAFSLQTSTNNDSAKENKEGKKPDDTAKAD
jgi:hypothetical protein